MSAVYSAQRNGNAAETRVDGGMWAFLLLDMSVFMLFFGMFLWQMGGNRAAFVADADHLLLPLGLANTLLLLASSYAVVLASVANRAGDAAAAARRLGWALAAGGAFAAVKVVEYTLEIGAGHTLTSSTFFTWYFVLTGLHLLHVGIGSLLLSHWRGQALRGQTCSPRWAESAGAYWHMVDLLWLLIVALVYVGDKA
ncbi:MAG: cytochrome c oxidase subunit 3 [Rudaea sp.]|uniref:cytochrome c oxidase subunit 3 n=1 Tax=Rudaea sp. TaxID=2136325 RepID=UPI0039E4FFD4